MRTLLAAALVAGLTLSTGPASAQEVVIGVLYPMSGAAAQAGTDDKPAFELARDIANGEVDLA